MDYIRCGSGKVPIAACMQHSAGLRKDGTAINPNPEIDVYACCIDCIAWIDQDNEDWFIESTVVKAKSRTPVARRNSPPKKKRVMVKDNIIDEYLDKCEDIATLLDWLLKQNMPSLLNLAKSNGLKCFGLKKDKVIGEIIALEGGGSKK